MLEFGQKLFWRFHFAVPRLQSQVSIMIALGKIFQMLNKSGNLIHER
jgi:hypothetical protein